MHNHRHVAVCAAVIVIAAMAVLMTGGAPGSIALLAAALLCPIAMGAAVWLLLRAGGRPSAPAPPERSPGAGAR